MAKVTAYDEGMYDSDAKEDDQNDIIKHESKSMFSEEDGDAGSPNAFRPPPKMTFQQRSVSMDSKLNNNTVNRNLHQAPDRKTMISTSSLPVTLSPPTVLESLKAWSVSTFKYTKQYVAERLGQSTKTVDPETEARVEALRETQRQYQNILRLTKALFGHYHRLIQTQKVLGDAFAELSQKSSELSEQFSCNAETQQLLSKNGETLLACLNVFMTSVSTLCNTTIEDTLLTVKNYDATRTKYDAYRLHLENLKTGPHDQHHTLKIQDAERIFNKHKQKFDRLHHDLIIKLKFLDENKVTVCQKHLYLLHKGFVSYVAGNRQGVEEVLKHFSITPESHDALTFVNNSTSMLNSQPTPTVDSSGV